MDLLFIIKVIIGLILLLGVLIAILFYKPRKQEKKEQIAEIEKKDSDYTFEELIRFIRDRKTPEDKLQWVLDTIVKYHGVIEPKKNGHVSDHFYHYSEIIVRLCRHPNTSKSLIVRFDKKMRELNPSYAKELNDSLTKGLNSRTS